MTLPHPFGDAGDGPQWMHKDPLLSQQGLETPVTPGAKCLQVSIGKLKKQDSKSNLDLNFHKMFAGFQLV